MASAVLSSLIHDNLKSMLNETAYELWISEIDFQISDDNKVRIISESLFKIQTIESALYKEIDKAVSSVLGYLPEIDYLFKDEYGNITSIFEEKERQKQLDEMNELLGDVVIYILENNTQAIIQYIAPDIKKGKLQINDNVATLDFCNISVLKVVKEYCSQVITESLCKILNQNNIKLDILYCGSKY